MKLRIACCFFLFFSVTASGQIMYPEQNAFDYFFNNVFKIKYPDIGEISFNGLTNNRLSQFDGLKWCFEINIAAALSTGSEGKIAERRILDLSKIKNTKFKRRQNNRRFEFTIYRAQEFDGKIYVYVWVTRPLHFVDAYMMEFTLKGEFIRLCKTGAVI